MEKEKKRSKASPLQWCIRILILVIFAVSLVIAAGRLMEWNQKQKELEELQKQEEQLGEQGRALQSNFSF